MKTDVAFRTALLVALSAVAASALADQPAKGENAVIATIAKVSGTVMINQGKAYVSARTGIQLHAGNRIVTMEKASVSVMYNDGCVQTLAENNLLTVRTATECSAKTAQVQSAGPRYAAIGDGTANDATSEKAAKGAGLASAAGSISLMEAGIGAGAVVGGAAAIKHYSKDDPVSKQ